MPSTPGTVNYPASLDDAVSLLEAKNGATTTLSASLSDVATTANVVSTALFPSTGAVTLGGVEIAYYTGKTGTSLTGLIRGADGTAAAAHASAATVQGRIIARHHTVLADAIIAAQAKLDAVESQWQTETDFSSQIDGVNVDFVTADAFQSGTAKLYLNGLRQFPVDDFSELNSTTLRLTSAPIPGDRIVVDYTRS